jgi:integral membrane protein
MLSIFRNLSLIEGISLIILLFIAMPAKYQFGLFDSIWMVGMTHGVLWLAYFALSLVVSHQQKWSVMFWLLVLFASVIPFACFFLDRNLKENKAYAES